MKKRLLLLLTVFTLAFAGCSKDDNKPDNSDIAGRWYVTHMESSNDWVAVKGSCLDGMYAEFQSNLTYKSYESCDNNNFTGTYTRSSTMITCKVDGATVTYRIIELSGNNATFEMGQDGDTIKMKAIRK